MRRYLAVFALLAAPALAQVPIQEVRSPSGMQAWLVEDHSIPFVALEIRFRGGASLDLPEKRGAVNLMAATLEDGTGDLDAQGFAAAREALAAEFGFAASDDSLAISARMLTENRAEAAALLRRALVEPAFPEAAVERVKGQVLSILAADSRDPSAIAGETFAKIAFGDHPYGSNLNGTVASVKALTRADLIEAKERVIARDRLYVGAVGDITPEELGALMEDLLGSLPATGAPQPEAAALGLKGGVVTVPFESPQSVILFGQQGIKMSDPEFYAAYVANQVLGAGGFSSRLMDEIREKRGLTYGVQSYLVPRDHAATWQGSLASANEKAAEAMDLVRAEWRKMAEGGVTEAELAAAKTYLTGAYPLRWEGNGQIAEILVGMQMDNFPIDYPQTRNAKIEAVTREDVARLAKRLLDADALQFVVVGQPVGVE